MNSQLSEVSQPKPLSDRALVDQNAHYQGTGGVSQGNRSAGFVPAFLDTETGEVYISRFANGAPAPIHLLAGLPASVVTKRTTSGGVLEVAASVIAGFVCQGAFYTREQAASAVAYV
jgi:hypothetical protein